VNHYNLELVAEILGINADVLKDIMLFERKKIGNNNLRKIPKKYEQVANIKQLFIYDLYQKLLDALIITLNTFLCVSDTEENNKN